VFGGATYADVIRRAQRADTGNGALPLGRLTGLIVNNTAHLANFRAFLDAWLDDGLLDVMEQSHSWPRQLLHNAAIVLGSRAFAAARLTQTCTVSLALETPERVMVDGEMMPGARHIAVHCAPRALACINGSAAVGTTLQLKTG